MNRLALSAEAADVAVSVRRSVAEVDALLDRLRRTGALIIGRSELEQRAVYEHRRALSREAFARWARQSHAELEDFARRNPDDASDPLMRLSLRFSAALVREARS